ncbi:MAG: endolytic transglycosylase MltG [Rhodospirillales bacterium]|nr:endolytic transglycosylase MltG [Rhodospirillales bacterium]
MRIFLAIVAVHMILIALVVAGIGLWGWQQYALAPSPLQQEKILHIRKGQGVSAIADYLEREDVISSALLFKLTAKLKGNDKNLKAGEYAFWPGMPMEDVMEQLVNGDVYQRFFTIPEGLTSWQIVKLLNGVEDLSGDIETIPAEGSLLPETYDYVRDESRGDKIAQMQKAMQQTLDELWESRADNLPVKTKGEALVLASIVEKETGVPGERRRVAGVFINRLRRGIALQTDPTVIYALTNGKIQDEGKGPLGRRLLKKDLEIDSPYNTYKYPGLPPGPIANPGRESIAAVLNPEQHDFIYFVADGTGGHVFSKTLVEHNANVAKWRKIRKGQ